jgi:DNA repair protein SbcD/Mre11
MRVVFCSDTHLGFDLPIRPRVERHRRGEEFFDAFDRVLRFAVDEGVDLVLHGGDLFFRSKLPPLVIDRVYARLMAFAVHGIPIGLIAGNHERSALPRSLLLAHPNVHVFHDASTHVFKGSDARLAVTGVPFVGDAHGFVERVRSARAHRLDADAHVLLAHEAFDGATVGPADFTFRARQRRDTIALEALPDDLDLVLSGHIHRRQVLWKHRTDGRRAPVIYAGSTSRTSPAENMDSKSFAVVTIGADDPARRSVRFVTLPSAPCPVYDRGAAA